MFDGENILITGGTGSLGQALTAKLLETDAEKIRIYSRDESKQVEMQQKYTDERLRFFIGDVRDRERLNRAIENVDIVIHAAALKHVPVAEYNPFEAVKTNVYGSQNVIESCLDNGVKTVLAIGTDKAAAPFNTYGATKLLMERLFISANFYKGKHETNFLCVRYGNVLGSRGSIVPKIVNQVQMKKKITITDPNMTRFTITMNQALDLIFRSVENGRGGELFVPKLKAYKTGDLKDAILELLDAKVVTEQIPVRPGEKFHESLISKDEIRSVYESEEDYIIFENQTQNYDFSKIKGIKKSELTDEYSSDKVELFSKNELKDILLKEKLLPISK